MTNLQLRVRDLIYYLLGIQKEDEVVVCRTVLPEDRRAWEDGVGGPSLEKDEFKFDWYGGIKSEWNQVTFLLLAEKIQEGVEQLWTYLPQHELFYYEETVKKKFSNLMTIWRASQPRRTGSEEGDFETEEQISERVDKAKLIRSYKIRQCTRRHTVSDLQMNLLTT